MSVAVIFESVGLTIKYSSTSTTWKRDCCWRLGGVSVTLNILHPHSLCGQWVLVFVLGLILENKQKTFCFDVLKILLRIFSLLACSSHISAFWASSSLDSKIASFWVLKIETLSPKGSKWEKFLNSSIYKWIEGSCSALAKLWGCHACIPPFTF